MRFLGILGARTVDTRFVGQVFAAEIAIDEFAAGRDGILAERNAIGPHIGDQTNGFAAEFDALIKPLRNTHGVGGAESELAAGLLLQRRGGERRLRIASRALALDRGDREFPILDGAPGIHGCGFVAQSVAVQPGTVEMRQTGVERIAALRRQADIDRPVLGRAEDLDFGFAIADQPQGDRLHTTGRARSGQLAPQHRRERKADQIVERAPCQIGIDQFGVYRARMGESVAHGAFGDLVEDDALDVDAVEQPALAHQLADRASTCQDMAKSSAGCTLPSLGGRSRTWPYEASTV